MQAQINKGSARPAAKPNSKPVENAKAGAKAMPSSLGTGGAEKKKAEDDDEGDSSSESSSSSDDDDEASANPAGAPQAYNAADYANLQVSTEIQDLFDYISNSLCSLVPCFAHDSPSLCSALPPLSSHALTDS
jgi:hypothetical protein